MKITRTRRSEFEDSIVLITGAASGIGLALTKEWLTRGARVAMLDIDDDQLKAAAQVLPKERSLAIQCDVTSVDACQTAYERISKKWGDIDVLVNNAGVSHHSELVDTQLDVLRRVIEINFFGAANLTHIALPALKRKRGRIVVLSSVAGFAPLVGRSGYAASKHALHGFFDTLRAELRDAGVAVTIACPSYVRTAIDSHAMSGDGSPLKAVKKTVGGVLEPADVAREVVDASYRRRDRVIISRIAKASYWVSRIAPRVFERAMRKTTPAVGAKGD